MSSVIQVMTILVTTILIDTTKLFLQIKNWTKKATTSL